MISHVYFDFFGTLVDYDPSVHPASFNAPYEFAQRAGLSVTPEEASARWQNAWDELDGRAQRTRRECSMHEIATRYWELIGSPTTGEGEISRLVDEYLAAWTSGIRLAQHATDCLKDLATDRYLAIVSNTHHPPLVPALVQQFGLGVYISDIVTSIELGWRKPDPRMFEYVLERDGIVARDAVFVGDRWEADVVGPTQAGMTAFYVGAPSQGRIPVTLAELPRLIRELG